MPKDITRDRLKAQLDSGASLALLEALAQGCYDEGHLPGAVNFPHDAVEALAPRPLPDKEAPVVVYCASVTSHNSHEAANRLAALGYAAVSVYSGGKQDWAEAARARAAQ